MTDVAKQMAQLAFENCAPLKALIELTTRCNYQCGHCYNFDRQSSDNSGDKGLTTSHLKNVIKQLSGLGIIELTFSGGEATLRPDLQELVSYAHQHHMIVALKTNGALLSPTKALQLMEAGLKSVEVNLYGFTAKSHDKFAGAKGSFIKTLENTKSLVQTHKELEVIVTIAVLKHSVAELEQATMIEREIGIPIRHNLVCHGRNTFELDSQTHAVDLETQVQLLELQESEIQRFKDSSNGDGAKFRCGCARTSFAIMANGDVVPCVEAPWKAGSVHTQSISEIWNSSEVFEKIRNLESADWAVCNGCELTQVCGRRNCSAFKYRGVYTDPDPAAGELTYERFKILGASKPPCLAGSSDPVSTA